MDTKNKDQKDATASETKRIVSGLNGREKRLYAKIEAYQIAASMAGHLETANSHEDNPLHEMIGDELCKIANKLEKHAQKLAKKNGITIQEYKY